MFPGERGVKKLEEWPDNLKSNTRMWAEACRLVNRLTNSRTGGWNFTKAGTADALELMMLSDLGLLTEEVKREWEKELEIRAGRVK